MVLVFSSLPLCKNFPRTSSVYSFLPNAACKTKVTTTMERRLNGCKLGAARYSEMLFSYHFTTWRYNPEDHNLNLHLCENHIQHKDVLDLSELGACKKFTLPHASSSRAHMLKVKVTSVLNRVLRHEDVWGSGDITPCILNLGSRWRWVVSFTVVCAKGMDHIECI
jgi:hypothetical protein